MSPGKFSLDNELSDDVLIDLENRRTKRRRALVIIGALACIIILLLALQSSGVLEKSDPKTLITLGGAGMALLGMTIFSYLEGSFRNIRLPLTTGGYIAGQEFPGRAEVDETGSNSLTRLNAEVQKLRREVSHLSRGSKQEEFDAIVKAAREQVSRQAADGLIAEVESRLDRMRNDLHDARHALELFAITRSRMQNEVSRLNRRGNVNLTIGCLITGLGAFMLWYYVILVPSRDSTPMLYAMHYLPRLSIVVLVQIFAFFFLKLYKIGLDEIKYLQNEITNIEQKNVALSVSLLEDDTSIRSDILRHIAITDRNTILQKGQTTVGLERSKIDSQNNYSSIVKDILPILAKR